jgi:hypothetical protein
MASHVFTVAVFWWVDSPVYAPIFTRHSPIRIYYFSFGEFAARPRQLFSLDTALRIFAASLLGGLATRFNTRTNSAGGCPRIARGEPWAGSITGGEACGYRCSEKEGFTHPPLWRAPCFWGTYESKLHAVDT